MKNNKLIDALGKIDDKYVKEAHEKKKFVLDFALVGKLATAALVLFLVVGVVPNMFRMGASKSSDSAAPTESYDLKDEPSEDENIYSNSGVNIENAKVVEENKKIIVTGNLNVETLDFDNVLTTLQANVKKYGGYIQNSSISTNRNDRRYYDACIRIPAESYEEFLSATKENVNVTYYNENIDDITETYTDIQARINSLKAEEEKVLEFYDKANNLEELMSVESRLTDIRYEIDSLETKIKNYDLLVNYSTLNIGITETKVYTKTNDNFFSKLGLNFVNGWSNFVNVLQDIILGIVYNLWIVILVVVVIVGIVIYRKKRNK